MEVVLGIASFLFFLAVLVLYVYALVYIGKTAGESGQNAILWILLSLFVLGFWGPAIYCWVTKRIGRGFFFFFVPYVLMFIGFMCLLPLLGA